MTQPQQYQNVQPPNQNVQPPKRGAARWLVPIAASFATLLLGYGLGAGGSSAGPDANCTALADEYSALVSKGIDAGLSMDESRMADVIAQRDALRADIEDACA